MLEQENAPSGELEAEEIGKLDCQFDSTFSIEEAREALAPQVAEKREAVAEWNDRVSSFRDKTEKPLPVSAFKNHPAFGDLVPVVKGIFVGVGDEEISDHVALTLSKVSKTDDGSIRWAGGDRGDFRANIALNERARRVASERADWVQVGRADQNLEWGSHLDFLLWDEDFAPNLPVTVAIREARYD
jgi:hypothetical protein